MNSKQRRVTSKSERQPCRLVLAEHLDGFEYFEPELSEGEQALITDIKWLYNTGPRSLASLRTLAGKGACVPGK